MDSRQSGGILVSGGNMANFVCFLAARTAEAGECVRPGSGGHPRLTAVCIGGNAHVDQ